MSANKTCGECRWAAKYEGSDATDPWLNVTPDMRGRLRECWCVCGLPDEAPQAFELGQEAAAIPCDFWEER